MVDLLLTGLLRLKSGEIVQYDFCNIEKKWRQKWADKPYFKTKRETASQTFYCLDMFPYPSGSGLHVGHWKGYVFSDLYARMKFLEGYNVLHPMGWDAFGLPAENDAIKKGIQPQIGTRRNIDVFKEQCAHIGAMYDWTKEINTTDPEYYKWTQWIFLKMYKSGLAYENMMPVNWCPSCKTGLANEEANNGACERCGAIVEQKPLRQWVLKITHYAESLLSGLDDLDWPERVKMMQRNWIGKSQGATVNFDADGIELPVYTTRPDTLFGATFVVIAPDHELVEKLITSEHKKAVETYCAEAVNMSDMERQLDKEKTGIFSGTYAVNPVNGQKVPVYVASYVLKHYGTGIIMAVPAHDERDFEFAQKFGIPMIQVVKPAVDVEGVFDESGKQVKAITESGVLINSGQFDGMSALDEGKQAIINWLVERNAGQSKVCYKLRDWIFSRQRYWGEPIPLIHCDGCGVVPVPEDQLPVTLPAVEQYEPTGTGESPLASVADWVNVSCPTCNGAAKRETNTMPQWAGSCWYFLRYPNPDLTDKPFDLEDMKKWMPVDFYVGGIEHAVLHLLYARFYVKFLHDEGYLPFDEPFKKLFNQGMVCMKSKTTGRVEKMSKSKGNVVNPDEIERDFGADTLRMYMLFMGPPEQDNEWSSDSIRGVHNFLKRLWAFAHSEMLLAKGEKSDEKVTRRFHRFLQDFQNRLEHYRVNTAVSSIMEFLNDVTAQKMKLDRDIVRDFFVSISIMVPHVASELLETLLGFDLADGVWPAVDASLAQVDEVEIAVQINGKTRTTITVASGADQSVVESNAKGAAVRWLEGKDIKRIIFVPNRLISFVVV